jgi:ABC-type iron transport system FetAB permease component
MHSFISIISNHESTIIIIIILHYFFKIIIAGTSKATCLFCFFFSEYIAIHLHNVIDGNFIAAWKKSLQADSDTQDFGVAFTLVPQNLTYQPQLLAD